MSNAPTIGVIGCGAIAERYHLPALASRRDQLGGLVLVDANAERVAKLADQFEASRHATNHLDVLEELDAVIVATPPVAHRAVTIDFLERDVHVLCEKPLAPSARDAKIMVEAAANSSATLSVNTTRRLFPAYVKVRELLASIDLGAVREITYYDGQLFSWPAASPFRFRPGSGTPRGALLDKGIHALDAVCWWLGTKPRVVSCRTDSFGGPEAVASVQLDHDGSPVTIHVSALGRLDNTFTIRCEAGEISSGVENWSRLVVRRGSKSEHLNLGGSESSYTDFSNTLTDNFLAVAAGDAAPLLPAANALAAIELLDECYAVAERFEMPWYDDLAVLDGP
ncbi:MAG: Gfo/Idh/MocA family protein [Gaiellaceae bacterium]